VSGPNDIPPLLLVASSLVLSSGSELLLRQSHARPIYEPGYMVIQTAAVFTSMTLWSVLSEGFHLTALMAGLGVVSGVLGYLTGWSFLFAMGRGPAAVTAAVRRASFVVTAELAMIFLGETLDVLRVSAMLLAIVAFGVMASDGDRAGRPHPMILVTVLASGGMAFCHKLAAIAGVSASAFLMCQSGTAHLASHAVCLRAGGYRLSARGVRFAAVTGSLFGVSMLCALYALRGADALVVVPVLQLSFLLTAPGSFVFFGEPVTTRKLAGLLLGSAAIVAFSTQLS